MKCPHYNKELEVDYKLIKYKNKNFRIYKWENKPFNKFKIPKCFRLCEFNEVVELFDEKLINYPETWEVYFTKHYSKRKQKEGKIVGLYLNRISDLLANSDDLSDSDDNGRVVVVEVGKFGR